MYTAIVFTIGVLVGCCVGMAGALVMYERIRVAALTPAPAARTEVK